MKHMKTFAGKWRIGADGTGRFQFGLVSGDIDGRAEQCGNTLRFEFSWSGQENDPVCGRGWAVSENDELKGRIYLHLSADFPRAWNAAHDEADKGHAHAYDAACRQLVDLRDAYSQHATLAVFQKEFQKFMTEHLRRRALVQRLVKAGLWQAV